MYVSRAGEKLEYALKEFNISVQNLVCADFGSNTGGFVDCLLQNGAKKVYSVETGYGVLDWNLRNDSRVTVYERSNAMHVILPEKVDFISIDVSWTPQLKILPNAIKNLNENGIIVSLVKPHYEASAGSEFKSKIKKGKLEEDAVPLVIAKVINDIKKLSLLTLGYVRSPIKGNKGHNTEYLFYIKPVQ